MTTRQDTIQMVEHRCFARRLALDSLGLGERLMSRMIGSAEGDYRDWEEIRTWARDIGHALTQATAVPDAATV